MKVYREVSLRNEKKHGIHVRLSNISRKRRFCSKDDYTIFGKKIYNLFNNQWFKKVVGADNNQLNK